MKNLSLALFLTGFAAASHRLREDTRKCLLQQKFYHQETGKCYLPLGYNGDGPCQEGSWLMPTKRPGIIECSPIEEKYQEIPEFCTPILMQRTKVGCLEEMENKLYQTKHCSNNQILLPGSFREGAVPCPASWSCQHNEDINPQVFQEEFSHLAEESLEFRYLRDLVCDDEKKMLCLPDNMAESLFSMKHLVSSLRRPEGTCQDNPCSEGSWPWLGDDGYHRCYSVQGDVGDCQPEGFLKLTEDGTLTCSYFELNSVLFGYRGRCRRGKVKINGKCIKLYG